MQMMINEFQWLCKMVAIGDDNLRVVSIHRDHHPLSVPDWIDLFAVYNDPNI